MRRSAEYGFTLIELLIALTIFAMIAGAGVMLLAQSVSAQGAVAVRLDTLAAVQRAASLLGNDLAQAVPRISRTQAGTLAPAFFAAGPAAVDGRPALQFVAAAETLDAAARPGLRKLEYIVAGGALQRRSYPLVDGAAPPEPSLLLDRVTAATFRFRDETGAWRGDWTPAQPGLMPRAVELTLARAGEAPVVLLFLVGPGAPEEPVRG